MYSCLNGAHELCRAGFSFGLLSGRGEGANKIIIFIFEGVLLLLQLVDAVENPVVDAKLPQLDSGRAREGGCE